MVTTFEKFKNGCVNKHEKLVINYNCIVQIFKALHDSKSKKDFDKNIKEITRKNPVPSYTNWLRDLLTLRNKLVDEKYKHIHFDFSKTLEIIISLKDNVISAAKLCNDYIKNKEGQDLDTLKRACRLARNDYDSYDALLYMDKNNFAPLKNFINSGVDLKHYTLRIIDQLPEIGPTSKDCSNFNLIDSKNVEEFENEVVKDIEILKEIENCSYKDELKFFVDPVDGFMDYLYDEMKLYTQLRRDILKQLNSIKDKNFENIKKNFPENAKFKNSYNNITELASVKDCEKILAYLNKPLKVKISDKFYKDWKSEKWVKEQLKNLDNIFGEV